MIDFGDLVTPKSKFEFGTKAETLHRLSGQLQRGSVLPCYYFSMRQWRSSFAEVINTIEKNFTCENLIVRSSAIIEDGGQSSMAGAFVSKLGIKRTRDKITDAVNEVLSSYYGNPEDQVLIQEMIEDAEVSGVITTFCLSDGAPYYVINYDDKSGKTDTITGGKGETNKTVLIYREKALDAIESPRVRKWVELAVELEKICCQEALDIEFGQRKNGEIIVFQVRRIASEKNWNLETKSRVTKAQSFIEDFVKETSRPKKGLAGRKTILGIMPDWNPAEIIGTTPRPLALSLYQYLITNAIWREARGKIGYVNPESEQLMLTIAGRPFIDVRNSFNTFLPDELQFEIRDKIVNAWLDRLNSHPEFHDKVEFEVAQTVLDFTTEEELENRYPGVLTKEEKKYFFQSLKRLTAHNLDVSVSGPLKSALKEIENLEIKQGEYKWSTASVLDILGNIRQLLSDCRDIGTFQFSIIARHAFMAEAFLRSAVKCGVINDSWLLEFKSTLKTVTSSMAEELQSVHDNKVSKDVFFKRYGHLRPGTYDIQSLRYDQRQDLFLTSILPARAKAEREHGLTENQKSDFSKLFNKIGMENITADSLLEFAKSSIVGREHAKFVFTKNLSDLLEMIANWGLRLNLTRDDLSYLTIDEVLAQLTNPILANPEGHFKSIVEERKQEFKLSTELYLSYIIRDEHDLFVVPVHRGAPNFVTNQRIEGRTIFLDSRMSQIPDLYNGIVCIENADPGFDWIFTRGIAGLITKFGGSNSHMSIRCAEFRLPAAIGCGEQTYERLLAAGRVELDCESKIVRPIYG